MTSQEKPRVYPSCLTDAQWAMIEVFFVKETKRGRPRKIPYRSIVNAIFYVHRTGCPWRYLPRDFPHWNTVYDYFQLWAKAGVWLRVSHALSGNYREGIGRSRYPSFGLIDSQSIKAHYGEERGYDGFKKNPRSKKTHHCRHAGTNLGMQSALGNDQGSPWGRAGSKKA